MKKEQVLISTFLIAILVLSSGSMVAFANSSSSGRTITVWPNGHDDTKDIQAAFYKCGSSPGCTVQLVKGTYYISQIAVTGFQGEFIGAGQGVTIIQALPKLPPPTTTPFYAALPSPENPWPNLFTFVNGAFSVSGMTVNEPNAKAVYPAYSAYVPQAELTTSLYAAIQITGEQASATIDHVTITGNATGTNLGSVIWYGGQLLPPKWSDPIKDIIALSGTFTLTNSELENAGYFVTLPLIAFLNSATVTVCHNTVSGMLFSFYVQDASNSKILFCGNSGSVAMGAGWFVVQSGFRPDKPSTVTITDNNFQVSQAANGAGLFDYGPSIWTIPSTLSAVMSGNTFTTDSSCGCYQEYGPGSSVILSWSLANTVASQNEIFGGGTGKTSADGVYITGGPGTVSGNTITGAYTGVWLDVASGANVVGNVIKYSAEYGIAVTSTNALGITAPLPSSNNFILRNFVYGSGAYDLYWDGSGTGNVWSGNICQTSSPPGLC